MSSAKKLMGRSENVISRGNVFRVSGKYPYESFVDFMVFETKEKEAPYGLMVTSGYKAGLVLIHLPKESVIEGGLSTQWVIENWGYWIYPECDVSDVYILEGYSAGPV